MKTTLIILLSIACLVLCWCLLRSKKFFRSIRAYDGRHADANRYQSNVFLGILLRANPFPVLLLLDLTGLSLVYRPWHGLKLKRVFYPIHMIRQINLTEYIGRYARIELFIQYSPHQHAIIRIPRFFPVKRARVLLERWIHYAHVQNQQVG